MMSRAAAADVEPLELDVAAGGFAVVTPEGIGEFEADALPVRGEEDQPVGGVRSWPPASATSATKQDESVKESSPRRKPGSGRPGHRSPGAE